METIRKKAATIAQAKKYHKALESLDAKAIRVEANGTWEAIRDGDLVFASSTYVIRLNREKIKAMVDGEEIYMRPYNVGESTSSLMVIAEL